MTDNEGTRPGLNFISQAPGDSCHHEQGVALLSVYTRPRLTVYVADCVRFVRSEQVAQNFVLKLSWDRGQVIFRLRHGGDGSD